MSLKLHKFVFSPFMENTYLVWDDANKETAIIDPGCYNEEERIKLENFIEKNELKVKYLVNTHCHIDHVFGNEFVKNKYNPLFIAPEEDKFLLDNTVEQAKMFAVEMSPSPQPDEFIYDGMSIAIGNIQNEFIFTPGHTPGEYSIYFPDDKICITGDVLFREGIGRTDLWGGNMETLLSSIKTRLFTLPDEVTIFPGHGEKSTIGHEKKNNPFLS
ncbi:MAG: MBL fold metallo-hydrolase [Melioribacteraceae bacterium]|nr:MBL fold metallo-hydrolase [Melioribacteraceae bacterium]WKZ71220.1 MAG: MBL fold metallo-hydrolase [Melioribacteraceae bacterium]